MPGGFVFLSRRFIIARFPYGRRENPSWCCTRPHSRTPWEYCRQRGAERGQILGPRHLVPTALYRALSSLRHCVHVAEINLAALNSGMMRFTTMALYPVPTVLV